MEVLEDLSRNVGAETTISLQGGGSMRSKGRFIIIDKKNIYGRKRWATGR